MIKFPDSTIVNKVVPKTAFYKHLEVNATIKNHFINDVERLVWAYKFATSTLNVADGKAVHEITVFNVTLKKKECPTDIFVFIDKNLPRHTAFLLSFEDEMCILINFKEAVQGNTSTPFKVTKTYKSQWYKAEDITIMIEGTSLDLIYENMIRQVAGSNISQTTGSLKADITFSKEQESLRNAIKALKKRIALERQPQKKFMLHKELKELENQIK